MKTLVQYTFDSSPLGPPLEYLLLQLVVGHGRITNLTEWIEIDNQCETPSNTEHTIFEIGIELADHLVKKFNIDHTDDTDIRKAVLAYMSEFQLVQTWHCGEDLYFAVAADNLNYE